MERFLALVFGIRRLASNRFKLLVAQARRVAARENQVRQISQRDALDRQRSNVVDECIEGNLIDCQQCGQLPHSGIALTS